MGEILEQRRTATAERIARFRESLPLSNQLADGKACIYATGSFARGEASVHSDLDLFIVGKVEKRSGPVVRGLRNEPKRLLGRLDEICLKAELIELTKRSGIPEFSGDGEYLKHYSVEELTTSLGSSQDDATNTFTARLLLLLESTPLVGPTVYAEAVEEVIAEYWGDFEDHSKEFMPGFLANDVLRIWRTFCVNYEARTQKDPPEKKAKRKLKNYKLKHSRLLTCYSALLYLLFVYSREGTVDLQAAREMTKLSPTERVEWLARTEPAHAVACSELIELYETFLQETDAAEPELIQRFLRPEESRRLYAEATLFGDKVFDLLEQVGHQGRTQNKFYRLLMV